LSRTNSKPKYVIVSNLKRRQLNDFQKAELAFKPEDIERQLAKRIQIEAGKIYGKGKDNTNNNNSISSIEDNLLNREKGRVVDTVSKKAGVSGGTYECAKKIIEQGSDKLKDSVRKGQTSINYVYKQIK
jgi:hypothetical protein